MDNQYSERRATPRSVKRQAIERLLEWGMPPRTIADQLGCSVTWIYTVRRELNGHGASPKRAWVHLLEDT